MFSSTVELEFQPVGLRDYSRIYAYTSVCGEGSCQHSPVSMYSLAEKYADEVCEKDGALYTLRARLSDRDYRVYLAPLGQDITKRAYENILADARAYGKKVKFLSLTQKCADKLGQYRTIRACGLRSRFFRQNVQIFRRQPDGCQEKAV